MLPKAEVFRLIPGREYSPSIEELFEHQEKALSRFLDHWRPLIENFKATEERFAQLPTLGVIGEGARPLELIRRSLLIAPTDASPLPGNYFRLRWILLDAGGRNSKKRYCRYGQDLRYSQYLFKWLAAQLGIECYDLPIKERASSGEMVLTEHFRNWISRHVVDLVLMSTFGYLLPEWMIELFKNWIINFHPAEFNVDWPNTEFRGPKPYPKMLQARIDMMVVVAYFIDGEFDRGSYLAKSKARSLHQVCKEVFGKVRRPRNDSEWFGFLTHCHQTMAEPTGQLFQDLSLALYRGVCRAKRDTSFGIQQFKEEHLPISGFFG